MSLNFEDRHKETSDWKELSRSHMKQYLCIGPSTYFQHSFVSMYSLLFHYHHKSRTVTTILFCSFAVYFCIYLLLEHPHFSLYLPNSTDRQVQLQLQQPKTLKFSTSMACNYPICTTSTLLGAMDSLWFHRLILQHIPDSISVPESISLQSFTSSCQSSSSCTSYTSSCQLSSSFTSIPEQDYALSDQSPLTPQQVHKYFYFPFSDRLSNMQKNHSQWEKKMENIVFF